VVQQKFWLYEYQREWLKTKDNLSEVIRDLIDQAMLEERQR